MCSVGARVVMQRAPVFDAPDRFDPRRVRLADLDGTGPNDVVYLGASGVVLWFNEAGNGWSRLQRLGGIPLPFPVHTLTAVTVSDLVTGAHFVSRYTYRHGYFDGVEREFRGFGRVEQ